MSKKLTVDTNLNCFEEVCTSRERQLLCRWKKPEGSETFGLTESDDIQAYLTTFKQVYDVDKAKWSFKLAPQLSGCAQQEYASMKIRVITISSSDTI